MAAPVAFGAAFIGALITKIVDTIVQLGTKKLIVAAALVASFLLSYSLVASELRSLLQSLKGMAGTPAIVQAGLAMLPSNIDEAVALILAVRVALFMFHVADRIIGIRAAS